MYPSTQTEAYELLKSLNAPAHLITHLSLVGEVATELVEALSTFPNLEFNRQLIEVGAAVHDAGKILFPNEMYGSGNDHEPAGKELLEKHGVSPEVAQCCVSHANYMESGTSFEERVVALADKLWKGKRVEELELLVIEAVASRLSVDKWSVFTVLDESFEVIAAKGDERLARSRS